MYFIGLLSMKKKKLNLDLGSPWNVNFFIFVVPILIEICMLFDQSFIISKRDPFPKKSYFNIAVDWLDYWNVRYLILLYIVDSPWSKLIIKLNWIKKSRINLTLNCYGFQGSTMPVKS